MSRNTLIESTAHYLDRMSKYQLNEETEGPDESEEERAPWLPRTLHDFLFHLSSPMDPTGMPKRLHEATTFDIKKGDHPSSFADNLPKTKFMMDRARDEGLDRGGSIHKKIGEGFGRAFEAMKTETPEETKQRYKEAKETFRAFAQSRGLKGRTAPKMLRGNMKTEKSSGEGVLTTGLNLAPHTLSGLSGSDVCPNASSECRKNCLGTTAGGNKQYPDTALSSKVLRTHFLAAHPEHAARLIDKELTNHAKKAKKKGMIPGARLNITSDIAWERHAPAMFERHKGVQFYDYTKNPKRVIKSLDQTSDHPKNYHLTLSHTGTDHLESNDHHVAEVLRRGGVVASVFHRGSGNKLPTHVVDHQTGHQYPVINGDDDDNTFDRHATAGLKEGHPGHGVVSGLILKGVKNEDAGHFATPVPENGKVVINKKKTMSESVIRFVRKT